MKWWEPCPNRSCKRPGQPETIGLGLSISRKLAQRMGGDLIYLYQDGNATFGSPCPLRGQNGAVLRLVEPIAS
jgi:signal transduction histidine kinase